MVYIEPDYPRLSTRFGRYCTKQLASYLRVMARETNRHFAADAALLISPDELGSRIVCVEKFLGANPRFSRRADLDQLYHYYLPAYLLGLNNTPAFDYQTNRLQTSFLNSYQKTTVKYRHTRFASLIQAYLRVLANNDYQRAKPVLDFVAKVSS